MNIRNYLRRYNFILGLEKDVRKIKTGFIKKQTKGIIQNYLSSHEIKKLQLGSGPNRLEGWLETDVKYKQDCAYLDITEKFPFEDDTLDYIFAEHLIEHVSWENGLFMLRECRRILKPGGIIRLATPDLEVFLKLYFKDNEMGNQYIKWITDRDLKGVNVYKASYVINNLFRNYGHQFLYDEDLLKLALAQAGFKDSQRVLFGESQNENLQGIESHGRDIRIEEMAVFETMIFEANK